MSPATWFNWFLVAQYIGLSGWYWLEGEHTKAMYWFGASVLGSSVAMMR